MVGELTETVIRTIQDAANSLTGAERRKFEGQVARDYCQGSARKAETVFGWGRVTVQTGLDELQTGMARENRYADRGRRKTEDKLPPLEEDIRKLLEPESQAKPAKKIPQTDAIFEHVKLAHARSDQEDDGLRISIDAKAKVKVGEFSRGGRSGDREPKKAGDHNMNP